MSERDRLRGQASRASCFEAIFKSTHRQVLAYALRRSADRNDAEEVVSETFLIAWRRLDALPAEPLPWLLGTARRVFANQQRAARRRRPDGPHVSLEHLDPPDLEPPPLERVTERDAFASAFAALRGRDREVLSLIAWDGLSVREAAGVLGCSAPTLSIRLHRARKRLLKELGSSGHSLGEASKPSSLSGRPGFTEAP